MDREAKRAANKFSRQNAALGAETTKFLGRMRLLVVGMRGVGVEVAKNCLLQGVSSLTIFDPTQTRIDDCGANFFLSPEDVGKPRDVVCRPRLQELNPEAVVVVADALDEERVAGCDCVVFCGGRSREELVRWNEFCRSRTTRVFDERGCELRKEPAPISFVWCACAGMAASVFVDHGPKFSVRDANGERPVVRLVESISSESRGLVRFSVPDGVAATTVPMHSCYEFSEVVGCDGLNGSAPWPVSKEEGDPANSFRIGDTTRFSPYVSGGLVTERKVPEVRGFKSLRERLLQPGRSFDEDGMVMTDFAFTGAEAQLHASLVGLLEFEASTGRLPTPNVETEAEAVVANAKAFVEACRVANRATGGTTAALDLEQVDEAFVRAYARHAAIEVQPVACFAGGVVAQEVVKCAGKYTPIDGFAHFSFSDALPNPPPPLADREARGCRYDDLIAIYGAGFVLEKLANLKYFMVGSGALGCEFVKNFALCGVCCGPQGGLVIADADRIELSNLTRQFLFREHNVGQAKCVAAAKMAVDPPANRTCANAMNVDLKVTTSEAYVGPKTESTLFTDDFWESLDGVCNALDNMEARFYVDGQCVKFEKPLLESGTMGTSGNVDPVVPGKTRTYREGGNAADDGGVPMCTLRNFPHLIDHCIEWARDKFAELFVKPAKRVAKFAADPQGVTAELKAKLDAASDPASAEAARQDIETLLKIITIATIPDLVARRTECAQLAFDAFHRLFRDQIFDLVSAYPADARVKDKNGRDKGPFWTGHRKFPTPAAYSSTNEANWLFLVATTHLLSQMVGGQPRKDEEDDQYAADERGPTFAESLAQRLQTPVYVSRAVDMSEEESLQTANADSSSEPSVVASSKAAGQAALDALLSQYAGVSLDHVQPEDFEKDDDYNFHVDFITSCANCRALNYSIPLTDHASAKLTAGRIVPAIATTTAAVTGLVFLELFKVVQGVPSTSLRTRQIGLGVNYYPSFDADNLIQYKTHTIETKPDPTTLPEEAFGPDGQIKRECYLKRPSVAYPDPHSVWTKLQAPPGADTWSLQDLKAWLQESHGLRLTAWNLHAGFVVEDDAQRPVSVRVYPPVETIDLSKLPALDLTKPKAMVALQRAGVKGSVMMKYLTEWDKYRKLGALPDDIPTPERSTADMTLREILEIKGNVDLAGRRRVLLDGLNCSVKPNSSGDDDMDVDEVDVEKLAPILLLLA